MWQFGTFGRSAAAGFAVAASLALSGCAPARIGPQDVAFSLGAAMPEARLRDWSVASVEIEVPRGLSVSRDPSWRYPITDIVWWEEAEGDRRLQVGRILLEAARDATEGLAGPLPVTLRLTLRRFHALTPVARDSGERGWHDIRFDVEVIGPDGAVLAAQTGIDADLDALQGPAARAAEFQGRTQRARIRAHLAEVLRAWLGLG